MQKTKNNQTTPKKSKAFVKLMAMMVILGFAAQGMAQPLPKPRELTTQRCDNTGGLVQEKTVNENGTLLTLKSYVTGEVITVEQPVPVDIVLVLDVSGSMDDKIPGTPTWESISKSYSYDDIEDGEYYYEGAETNEARIQVEGVANSGFMTSTYCYMWFDVGNKRYYLKGTSVIEALNQTDPTYYYGSLSGNNGTKPKDKDGHDIEPVVGTSTTIWTGTLWHYASGSKITKIKALQNAVCGFIDQVKQQAIDHPISDLPADHRISIVKFAENEYYQSASYLGEGNHNVYGEPNYVEVVKNFYNANNYTNDLKTAVNALTTGDATAADYGMNKATYLFSLNQGYSNPSHTSNDAHKKVVVLFTDGDPTHSSGFSTTVANSTIQYAKRLKDAGATVFTVGVFESLNENETKYMNYVSSNYPYATSMTNSGSTPYSESKYFFNANDAGGMNEMFTTIAQEICQASMQLNEQTIVQDVISDYFQLPQGTTTSDIKVYTAPCTGGNQSTQTYTFGTRSAYTSANIVLTTYQGRQAIRVSNFNYTNNYVAIVNGTPRGKELIIEIPIQPKYNQFGNLPTNADGSTIYPNGDTNNPLDEFPVPHYFVKQATWVEHVNTQPSGWALDNIDSKEDLAWLISYVSGYNGQTAHPNAVAKLTADVDMGDYCWVPIGGSGVCYNKNSSGNWVTSGPAGHGFSGTFDGQGHVIKNIKNDAYTMPQAGMFGLVNGGTIQNVFITNADFHPAVGRTPADGLCTGTEGHFGIIADTICNGGVLKNSEAQGWIKTYSVAGPMNTASGCVFPNQDPTDCYIGGLVGLVGRNKAGYKSPATVHSCISVASLAGYSMGGVVNEIGQDSKLNNSYSYPTLYSHVLSEGTNLGGLVAVNTGKVANCYLRERASNAGASQYGIKAAIQRINSCKDVNCDDWCKGLLVGKNQGTVKYCYVPSDWSNAALVDGNQKTTAFVGYGCPNTNKPSALASFSATSTPYLYKHHDNQVTSIAASGPNNMIPASPNDRLMQTLNAWTNSADGAGTTKWFRTTADGINNDYPVLKIAGLQSVASDDQVVLFYGDVNNALSASGRTMMTTAKTDDVICLYENAAVTQGNNGTTLYINEDVAITQTQALNAYVGITLDNSAGVNGANPSHPSYEFGTDGIDWHMFATSLSNAPMGINYTDVSTHPFNNHSTGDTPQYNFFAESVYDGYFPSKKYGTNENYYADWDFYCWSEPYYHYINFKRNKNDHYFEKVDGSGAHATLNYSESDQPSSISGNANLIPGKGYMLAVATETFLQSHGTLNNGNITRAITKSESNTYCAGYNLVGNPYQSYLDFDAFANTNGINTYAIIDEDQRGYVTYTKGASSGMRYINMHQGFFVETSANKTLSFTNSMRNITATATTFRGEEQSDYPYLELTVTDANGFRDYTTIEFGRPELGGGKKMMDLRLGDAQIYAHYEDVNYSTFFATNDVTSVPVRFTTVADGSFTLSWEIANSRFGNLILVDNLNGQTIDMLSRNTYMIEGHATDYASRFKIVFELVENGVEEDEAQSEDDNFAFQMESNIVVNGQGRLEMFDISGRLVMATDICDVQSIIALPEMAKGVYVMRLANNKSIKTQKIVIR